MAPRRARPRTETGPTPPGRPGRSCETADELVLQRGFDALALGAAGNGPAEALHQLLGRVAVLQVLWLDFLIDQDRRLDVLVAHAIEGHGYAHGHSSLFREPKPPRRTAPMPYYVLLSARAPCEVPGTNFPQTAGCMARA